MQVRYQTAPRSDTRFLFLKIRRWGAAPPADDTADTRVYLAAANGVKACSSSSSRWVIEACVCTPSLVTSSPKRTRGLGPAPGGGTAALMRVWPFWLSI